MYNIDDISNEIDLDFNILKETAKTYIQSLQEEVFSMQFNKKV